MRNIDEGVIEELLCRRLSVAIAKAVPREAGAWPRYWQMVSDADRRFLSLLPSYHRDEVSKKRVEQAGNELFLASKAAGVAWEQAGRPAA